MRGCACAGDFCFSNQVWPYAVNVAIKPLSCRRLTFVVDPESTQRITTTITQILMEVYVISVETGLTVWHDTHLNTCRILKLNWCPFVRSMVFNLIFSSPQIVSVHRHSAEIKRLCETKQSPNIHSVDYSCPEWIIKKFCSSVWVQLVSSLLHWRRVFIQFFKLFGWFFHVVGHHGWAFGSVNV